MIESLADFTGPYRESGEESIYRDCPVCGSIKWKLHLNHNTGGWFCFAGAHSSGGYVDVAGTAQAAGQAILSRLRPVTKPVSYDGWPEAALPEWEGTMSRRCRAYLDKREISASDCTKLCLFDVADDKLVGRVLVPYFNFRLEPIYWTARSYASYAEGPKYKGAPGPKPLYVPGSGLGSMYYRLVLVEGPFDAIRLWQAGYHAVALGGLTLTQRNERDLRDMLYPGCKLDIMLDQGTLPQAIDLQKRLGGQIHVIDGDPGSTPVSKLQEMLG